MKTTAFASRFAFREADLATLWEGQRFPPEALRTVAGEQLQVVYRGRRGRGPGPDFLDAIIATADGHLFHGDIELHLLAKDFYLHGHHGDPAYNNVVLHVVLEANGEAYTRLSSGRLVPVLALGLWASENEGEMKALLAGQPLWREPCHEAMAKLGQTEVIVTLDRLGDRRFAQKVAASQRALSDTDIEDILYEGIVETMGYGGERDAFRVLGQTLDWQPVRDAINGASPAERTETAEAILFGAAGLLSPPPAEPYPEKLSLRWRRLNVGEPAAKVIWQGSSARPGNHPYRRLAGLARLLVRYAECGLAAGFRKAVESGDAGVLLQSLSVPADGFWASHLDFSGRAWSRSTALIGRGRAIEIATNAVLPALSIAGQLAGDIALEGAASAVYRDLPLPAAYGSVTFLKANLEGGKFVNTARRQQGLLYLLENYCSRGGCGRCPLS